MEWTVVTVIIAIVGLIGTVAVPLGKNTKAMTQLAEQINHLNFRITDDEKDFNDYKQKASLRHKKIFNSLDKHETELINHEYRLTNLEKEKKQ